MDDKIARLIWKEILQRSVKVLTWGFVFATVQSTPYGTKFYVSGSRTGWVSIQQEPGTNLYNISITPDGDIPCIFDRVAKDEVVDVIDEQLKQQEAILV